METIKVRIERTYKFVKDKKDGCNHCGLCDLCNDVANLIDEEKHSPALKALNTIYHALLMHLDKPAYEDEYATVAEFIINRTPKILRMNNANRVYKKKPIERRQMHKKEEPR